MSELKFLITILTFILIISCGEDKKNSSISGNIPTKPNNTIQDPSNPVENKPTITKSSLNGILNIADNNTKNKLLNGGKKFCCRLYYK